MSEEEDRGMLDDVLDCIKDFARKMSQITHGSGHHQKRMARVFEEQLIDQDLCTAMVETGMEGLRLSLSQILRDQLLDEFIRRLGDVKNGKDIIDKAINLLSPSVGSEVSSAPDLPSVEDRLWIYEQLGRLVESIASEYNSCMQQVEARSAFQRKLPVISGYLDAAGTARLALRGDPLIDDLFVLVEQLINNQAVLCECIEADCLKKSRDEGETGARGERLERPVPLSPDRSILYQFLNTMEVMKQRAAELSDEFNASVSVLRNDLAGVQRLQEIERGNAICAIERCATALTKRPFENIVEKFRVLNDSTGDFVDEVRRFVEVDVRKELKGWSSRPHGSKWGGYEDIRVWKARGDAWQKHFEDVMQRKENMWRKRLREKAVSVPELEAK
jgi:hypothetical protein